MTLPEVLVLVAVAALLGGTLVATFGKDWWLRRRGRDPWEGSE